MTNKRPEKKPDSAYDKALSLLVRREHSTQELRRKLRQRGYENEAAVSALNALRDRNQQSDLRFAESLIRQRVTSGYGPRRIQVELKSHGLPEATIRTLLADAAPDWRAVAQASLRRRYGAASMPDAVERAKRAQFLLRRGFDAATVRGLTGAVAAEPVD